MINCVCCQKPEMSTSPDGKVNIYKGDAGVRLMLCSKCTQAFANSPEYTFRWPDKPGDPCFRVKSGVEYCTTKEPCERVRING